MPKIMILSGIPNSGKSTFTKQYQDSCSIISRDTIRDVFFSRPYIYTKQNEDKVTKISNHLFDNAVLGQNNIILDNTHCKEKYIDEILRNIPEGYTPDIIFFDCPLWKAHVRNIIRYIWRGKWIPIKVMNDMYKNYNKINRQKYEYLLHE